MRPAIALLVLLGLAAAGCSAAPSATAAPPPKDAGTGPTTIVIPSIVGVISAGWAPDWSGIAGTSAGCMRSIGPGRFALAPVLADGDRLLSLAVEMTGDFSAGVSIDSIAVALDGTVFPTRLGSLTVQGVPDGFGDYVIDLVDTVLANGMQHWIELAADRAGACVGAVRLTYDHPVTL